MTETTGFALLVDIENSEAPIGDGIYCFATEEEAIGFAVEQLIKVGFAKRVGGKLWTVEQDKSREEQLSEGDLLHEFQESSLSVFDYYHIREIKAIPAAKLAAEPS